MNTEVSITYSLPLVKLTSRSNSRFTTKPQIYLTEQYLNV